MTLNLKTEIEKINQGCGERIFPKENPDNIKCGTIWNKRIHLCPSCQKYKQGLIQGAKIMIEEIKKISEEYFDREYFNDFPKEPFETLKQLNNWLEKE